MIENGFYDIYILESINMRRVYDFFVVYSKQTN